MGLDPLLLRQIIVINCKHATFYPFLVAPGARLAGQSDVAALAVTCDVKVKKNYRCFSQI